MKFLEYKKPMLPRTNHMAMDVTIEWTHKRKNSHYISMIR
ncbi:hypothetical protein D1AOALGA4SA_5416 [Olavius algarvensis Delta 1 endosymbiont]|nr:hypothetical protein D1AOALGA4SA_5416 [Olavius algarvensis Delta 1 endosymbiont]